MMNQLLMSVLSQRKSAPPIENYVRFVSASARTINPKYTNSGVTLQYSVNGGATWTNISSGRSTTSSTEHWFRGQATGTKRLFTSYSSTNNAWTFSGSSDLEVYGNLNFLLCDTFGDKVAPTTLGTYAYAGMFDGCSSLTTSPELPATTMGGWCYQGMFRNCTSLTTPPALPATTLEYYCYAGMFNGCTSLTTPPELPVTTLPVYCYQSMFRGCTSLTTAPELPATTMRTECYREMFQNCTSLTTAPELPATTLADNCYQSMFKNCTSLTTASALPATTLTDNCYYQMFQDCTSLTVVPALPATTMAYACYFCMFDDCASFKVSATQTGSYIYPWRIPTSGTGTIADNWNAVMLSGTGGTFKSNPTINTTYYVENQPV